MFSRESNHNTELPPSSWPGVVVVREDTSLMKPLRISLLVWCGRDRLQGQISFPVCLISTPLCGAGLASSPGPCSSQRRPLCGTLPLSLLPDVPAETCLLGSPEMESRPLSSLKETCRQLALGPWTPTLELEWPRSRGPPFWSGADTLAFQATNLA